MATDESTELLPCAICARTFKPLSLEKHTRVCEIAANKKRKPFDSAKQRIQGTELAEFLPKETTKRKVYQTEDKIITNNKGSWKQTHDEFLRAIRAARGETIESTPQRHQVIPANNVTTGVPTRPNEKGICPTCNRQFSIKSYERHVAWCKERATRVPMSAATNIAKERLEARMKYRVPALKNRRLTNREKYSPLSAINLTNFTGKNNNGNATNLRTKETASTPNCNKGGNENATGDSQKSTVNTRRSGQSREGISSGPMKSRLSDRSSRPSGEIDSGTTSNCPSPRQNSSRISNNVFHRLSRQSPTRTNFSKSSNSTLRNVRKNENSSNVFDEIDENFEQIDEQDEKLKVYNEGTIKNRRHRQNIVHTRSHGNPRVNDITINDDVMGMTVQPCVRNKNKINDEEFVTWKKISEKNLKNNEFLKLNSMGEAKSMEESQKSNDFESTNIIDNKLNYDDERSIGLENISWTSGIEKLDQTYLIRESLEVGTDFAEFCGSRKRRPVIDSPRIEFYYDKKSLEKICFQNVHVTSSNEFRDKICAESSSGLRVEEKNEKFEGNLNDTSSLLSGPPKLEPLNLTIIDNEDTEWSETSRSQNSTKTSETTCRSKFTKNTPKLKPIFGSESSRVEKIDENLVNKRSFHEVNLKLNKNENFAILDTSRSSKSTRSLKNKCEKLATKKIKSIIGNDSICTESSNFGTYDVKNNEKTFSDDDNVKINKSEIDHAKLSEILDTSRSLKNTVQVSDDIVGVDNKKESIKSLESSRSLNSKKSSITEWGILTEKIGDMKSIIGKESLSNDSLNFGSYDDKHCDDFTKRHIFDEIDLKMDKDDTGQILETSRSLKGRISSKMNCTDLVTKEMAKMQSIVANFNFQSYDEKNCKNLSNNDSPKDTDLKIDNGENIKIPCALRSFDSTALIAINCRDSLTKENGQSAIEKKSYTDEQVNGDFDEIENQEKSFNDIIDRTIRNENKTQQNRIEIGQNKVNDRNEKSADSLMEKNNKQIEKSCENDNASSKMSNGLKTTYQRCGTYVIDKKIDSNINPKHEAPDDYLDDKPFQKRRKTENIASKEDLKKSSNSDGSMKKKSTPADLTVDPKKCVTNHEVTNEPKVEKNENIREICEQYVNKKFNYDSDDTMINEIFFKDYEPESSTQINEKMSSGTETSICEYREKAFSDSYVTQRKISLESTFSNERELLEVQKCTQTEKLRQEDSLKDIIPRGVLTPEVSQPQKSREKNSMESTVSQKQEIPKVSNSSEIRQKSREKNVSESSFSRIPEKPEVQNSREIRRKLREKMILLRGSTNNLITSIETSGNVIIGENSSINVAPFETKSTREIQEETIREIDLRNVGNATDTTKSFCGFLPEIPIDRIIAKNENSRSENKFAPLDGATFSWQKAMKNSNSRLINLDAPKFHHETKIPTKRLTTVGNLPPVVPFGNEKRRMSDRDSRPAWSNYVRRRPDFNLVLTGRTGNCTDYDPFLIAERQMNELLSDTCSEQSLTDSPSNRRRSSSPSLPNYPLSHSSAFVKYPDSLTTKTSKLPEKRVSLIAPPTEFDDLSSDSTETNSISREIHNFRDKNTRTRENSCDNDERRKNLSNDHVLGRRVIIDRSKALGTKESHDDNSSLRTDLNNTRINDKLRRNVEKITAKRSNSVRIVSAPKANDRKINGSAILSSNNINTVHNGKNRNYASLSGSNVSLSSIVSSEIDVKRSHSMFDELASSFEDDTSGIYPSLRHLLKDDSLSVTSPVQSNRPRNGQISDEEFSSPDSYKRQQEHNKLSADSAYSSLNRKYSNHGRSTNDMAGRQDEDSPLRRRDVDVARSKMSKFCHECGSKFPDIAKFCCECGIRRLAL